MLYRPENGRIWDPSVVKYGGKFYAFTMYYADGKPESFSTRLAISDDGVHWTDTGDVITDEKYPVWKMTVFRTRDGKFSLNHGSMSYAPGHGNDTLRYYVSDDLLNWTYVGSNTPDEKWYEQPERWDHMYCIPSEKGGYIGYAVAVPLPEHNSLIGIQRSDDGIHWHSCPPPQIDWDGIEPVREMEVGGCEKIGDKYYLMGGICPPFDGNYAYSCYVFTADNEDGPFKPDKQALRLCGFNGRRGDLFVQTLAAFCRNYDSDELLLSNTVWYELDSEQNLNWLLPLRSVKVDDDGHMRLHYYSGNDALKGKIVVKADDGVFETKTHEGYQLVDEHLLSELVNVDVTKGAVIEGTLTAEPWPARGAVRAGCWLPSMAGFYIEEDEKSGTAIFAECANTENRSIYIGNFDREANAFIAEDRISKGVASPTGLDTFVPHSFRLLIRYGMFELYFDDMLVQTYTCKKMPTGKIMLALQNCKCRIENVTAYEMTL
ncbi:MAG: hypothetical protein E7491_08375 [Ruminococcaceae bacterium]|nr:hypothetical protein [Oscillospiraceae bacterium]